MKEIFWEDAFLLLNKWQTEKSDLFFMKGTAVEGETGNLASGLGTHIISTSAISGIVELEVNEEVKPFDLRGASFRYEDDREPPFVEDVPERHPCSLEVTFPDGEVWVFNESPLEE